MVASATNTDIEGLEFCQKASGMYIAHLVRYPSPGV